MQLLCSYFLFIGTAFVLNVFVTIDFFCAQPLIAVSVALHANSL